MDVRIQGTNLELTAELYDFVETKLADCERTLGDVNRDPIQIDVELEKTTRRHPKERDTQQRYRAEANVSVPGRLIRAEGSAADIHQAIVEMKHHLMRELRRWRERLIDERRAGGREAKQTMGEEIEAERQAGISDEDEARFDEEISEFSSEADEEA